MKQWIIFQALTRTKTFNKKKPALKDKNAETTALDEWFEKRIELIENLATSPHSYKKLIRIEWLAVFSLSAWLLLVFATILN